MLRTLPVPAGPLGKSRARVAEKLRVLRAVRCARARPDAERRSESKRTSAHLRIQAGVQARMSRPGAPCPLCEMDHTLTGFDAAIIGSHGRRGYGGVHEDAAQGVADEHVPRHDSGHSCSARRMGHEDHRKWLIGARFRASANARTRKPAQFVAPGSACQSGGLRNAPADRGQAPMTGLALVCVR